MTDIEKTILISQNIIMTALGYMIDRLSEDNDNEAISVMKSLERATLANQRIVTAANEKKKD